ncbi:Pal1 cell morphology protein-domain-containing protein [Russula aff. rugulosa BPL654]|nr:Pal1 cell morphology protein-domain-containing protein [Russula aff. rugulosa BPL654]
MSNPFSEAPPPLPPKQTAPSRRQQQHQSFQPPRSNTRTDPSHTHHPSRSTDTPSRTRPNRSQTTGPASTTVNTTSRPQPPPARRSHSSDSAPSDKTKAHRSKGKKGSVHADIIDRLDFTGVGPMFHHDGPFDACAPSRNKHRTKAPMYAWTSINAEDEQVAAHYRDKEEGTNSKKVDALAEAWGIHEPEPYEEFFAGGGDHDGPITNSSSMREARSNGRRTREDLTSRPRGSNRIPPPQPIFVPDVGGDEQELEVQAPQFSPIPGGANMGRNKSIIQRIRKMRDSPNVPVGFDETMEAPADGRFVRGGRPAVPVGRYAVADDRAKELPATPTSPMNGYFDAPTSPGGGLGRKTSILKRVRGVVYRGSK